MTIGKRCVFFFSSRRRHTRCSRDWSSDVLLFRSLMMRVRFPSPAPDFLEQSPSVPDTHPPPISHGPPSARARSLPPPTSPPLFSATFFRSDRKSTRLNSSHGYISYAVFCLKKKKT